MFWSCKGFESHIAKGIWMWKAELNFLDSMEHMRLEIHWSRIATKITDGFPWGGTIPTAFQLCAENDLGAWNSSCFPRSNMKCFSCTGKDRFGFWKLTKIPGEIQADGWLVDWRNRNLQTQIEGFHQTSALLLGWKSRVFLVCPDDIDHRDCEDMLLNCWPLHTFCPYQKHNDLSMQIRSKTTSPTSQLPHLNRQPSTWIILGFWESTFSPHRRFPAAYSQSERPLFTKGTATIRDHGGSCSLSRRPWWGNSCELQEGMVIVLQTSLDPWEFWIYPPNAKWSGWWQEVVQVWKCKKSQKLLCEYSGGVDDDFNHIRVDWQKRFFFTRYWRCRSQIFPLQKNQVTLEPGILSNLLAILVCSDLLKKTAYDT